MTQKRRQHTTQFRVHEQVVSRLACEWNSQAARENRLKPVAETWQRASARFLYQPPISNRWFLTGYSCTTQFKFNVALEAVKEAKTVNQLAGEYGLHPNQVSTRKKQLLTEGPALFGRKNSRRDGQRVCHAARLLTGAMPYQQQRLDVKRTSTPEPGARADT